jgi:hypothetical protein
MRVNAINAVKTGQTNLSPPENLSKQTCEMFIRSLNCELEPQFGASLELDDSNKDTYRAWLVYSNKNKSD